MADHQEEAAPQLPEPAAQTFTDQIDADRAAIDWLLPMVPDGRERVFWSMSHKQFEQPSEGGNVRVLRVKGRVVAATICIRDDLNRTNLLRWGGTDSFRAAGVAEALADSLERALEVGSHLMNARDHAAARSALEQYAALAAAPVPPAVPKRSFFQRWSEAIRGPSLADLAQRAGANMCDEKFVMLPEDLERFAASLLAAPLGTGSTT